MSIKKNNHLHNIQSENPPFGKMINGQALGAVSKFRYGICPMSFNGCEVIAVHNALVYLGKPEKLSEISLYMERFRVLAGFFGCNVYKIGKVLRNYGVTFEKSRDLGNANAFIVSFWTKSPLLSSVHTVFCVRTANGIKVYNKYNQCPDVRICGSIKDIIGKYRPIAVYVICGGQGELSK